jgi:hypothetical protein
VAPKTARTLVLCLFLGLGFGLLGGSPRGTALFAEPLQWTGAARSKAERQVFLGGNLSDEQIVTFTTTVFASGHPGVVLLDSANSSSAAKNFLASFQPERVIPVGSFPEGITDLERRLNITPAPGIPWTRGPPEAIWQALFPQARRVVVCPAKPRRLLLHAACLAGVVRAPLVVLHDTEKESDQLRRRLARWQTSYVYAVGGAAKVCRSLGDIKVYRLTDEQAVATAYLRRQVKKGPVRTLVVANPSDNKNKQGGMSALAPWIALQKRAVLLLTNDQGDNTNAIVRAALKNEYLLRADALILVADLKAIPMEQRPNPIPADKDPYIEMEPLTPRGAEPFSFATGRLFNEDPSIVALLLARQRLLRRAAASERKVLVVSNPAGGLPLLEAFSRNTAKEFANRGYQMTTMFGHEADQKSLRKLLPEQDIFLWEGHHNTLIREYCVQEWPEPLRPALVFLQSCLALAEPKAQPFLERGAIGVVGSSTRTYSGSGGACAMAFFDALHYDHQTVGGSLRHAKNFLLAYSLLKEKRLGKNAKHKGANTRASWAFTLWGDPTVKLPTPKYPDNSLAPVRHKVIGNTIVISLPDTAYPKVVTSKYQTRMRPNARMAGLLRGGDEDGKRLVPFVFTEVHLPKAPPGKVPHLRSRIPGKQWIFCWDGRRQYGYLLITPRAKDQHELRFRIQWEDKGVSPKQAPAEEVETHGRIRVE